VKKFIDLGAKVNDENDKGADALHSACCAGRLDVVELLLASGADVNAKGGKHRNALNAASAEGYLDIVQALLAAGADPMLPIHITAIVYKLLPFMATKTSCAFLQMLELT
jgi:ankyrin repeat protein